MALWNTPMYRRWYNIKSRCQNPKNEKYPEYGGRGITLDPRWEDFSAFYVDMGNPPSPEHTVGRMDNDGPYSPENCRWEDPVQQSNNRRTNVRINGLTLAQHARLLGLMPEALRYRIAQGLSTEEVLSPVKKRKAMYGVPIRQLRLDGSVVGLHDSLRAAGESLNTHNRKVASRGVWRVCQKQRRSYMGFCWEYGVPGPSV